MSKETVTGWQSALDRRLVNRITRPLVKQGIINNVLSRSILSRNKPLLQRHPILNRTLQRLKYSEIAGIKRVPIIYRVQQGSFDRTEGGEGISRGSFSTVKETALKEKPLGHPGSKTTAGDGNIKGNSGVGVQKKGFQSKPDISNTDNMYKFQTDMLEKKLNPGIAGTKVSDTVLNRAKKSILNSPLSSKIVQKQINTMSGVKPERNIPVIFKNASVGGTGSNTASGKRPDNSGNNPKTNRTRSGALLMPPGLNYPANTIGRKKEKSIESSIGNEGISEINHESPVRVNNPAGKKPGDVIKKQVAGSTVIRTKRNGGGDAIAPNPAGQKTAPPGNEIVFTKRKGINGLESGKHPESKLPKVNGEKHSYAFRQPQQADIIPTPTVGNNESNSMINDSPSADNKFSAVGSRIVTGITQGNNTLLRHIDRKVIWRKHAGYGQNGGMDGYSRDHEIQRGGGNRAIVHRTPAQNIQAINSNSNSEFGNLNDQGPPLAGRAGAVNINKIAEKVGKILYKKLVIERERRGLGRWA